MIEILLSIFCSIFSVEKETCQESFSSGQVQKDDEFESSSSSHTRSDVSNDPCVSGKFLDLKLLNYTKTYEK